MVEAQEITKDYAVYCGDSCEVLPKLKPETIGLAVHSPPFCGLYQYSSSSRDLSNARSYTEFLEHYGFVIAEEFRLLKPGRISAVHCMDVPKDGANICGYIDFPGDLITEHVRCRKDGCSACDADKKSGACGHGWFEYLPRICIWKEPLGVRNRTMAKALTHMQTVEDCCLTNVAAADYLIPFRKRGVNPSPVVHPTGFSNYYGERVIPHELLSYRGWTGKQTENRLSHWIWRQYASCFWDDIRIDNVLPYEQAKDPLDEKHPHPLQLDVIERCVALWSNPGDVVLTPCMGVGSEVYTAVRNRRRAVGVELKRVYYNHALKNIKAALTGTSDDDALPLNFSESPVATALA